MWIPYLWALIRWANVMEKREIFCWLALTLDFLSHFCVQSTELHGNGASTKPVPAQKCGCAHAAFHTSWGCTIAPVSLSKPQGEKEGLCTLHRIRRVGWHAMNLQSFTQQKSWVKTTGFSDQVSDPALFLQWHSLDRARPRGQGWRGRIQQPVTDSFWSRYSFGSLGFLSSWSCTSSSR